MRKGAKRNEWTTAEIQYLKEHAGRTTKRDIQFALKRSESSIKLMAHRLGLSLRVPLWRLVWCDECAAWRTSINERTGRCKVCQARANLSNTESRCTEVYQRMTAAQKEVYDESETKRGRRKEFIPRPKFPEVGHLNEYAASKAKQDYYKALEAWNLEKVDVEYTACRKRLERMRRVLGENPREKK